MAAALATGIGAYGGFPKAPKAFGPLNRLINGL